jgi:hypothetical protein
MGEATVRICDRMLHSSWGLSATLQSVYPHSEAFPRKMGQLRPSASPFTESHAPMHTVSTQINSKYTILLTIIIILRSKVVNNSQTAHHPCIKTQKTHIKPI